MDINITKHVWGIAIHQSLDAGPAEIGLSIPAASALADFLANSTGIRSGVITIAAGGTYPVAGGCGHFQMLEAVFGLTIFRHMLGYTIVVDLDRDSFACPDSPLLGRISAESGGDWSCAILDECFGNGLDDLAGPVPR
jgi:hypothetical protein